ncbi:MAG: TrkA family potassium uptake protein [Acidimicrobiales bacterium]|nr:TrkA family potassium uptake protein [Acidimicrobiales bacterium]
MPLRAKPGIEEVVVVHVIVVGCGRVGSGLATTLEAEGHTVAVIDRQKKAFRRLPEGFKGKTIVGVGFDRDNLRAAGIEQAGALAAVTNGDNSNIVVARVAREAFGIERVVARIYDSRRAQIYERLGIPTVPTVQWTTERVLRRILPDAHAVEWVDPSAKVAMVERAVPSHWGGRLLSELEVPQLSRLVALSRLGESMLIEPQLVAQEGDVVWVMVAGDRMDEFERLLASAPETGAHG